MCGGSWSENGSRQVQRRRPMESHWRERPGPGSMVGLWVLIAAACGAALSEAQYLQRDTMKKSDVGFSEALQGVNGTTQVYGIEEKAMESRPFRHANTLLVSAASFGQTMSAIKQQLLNTRPRPFTRPWALEAACKAAAHMLSHHLAQCLAVVTYTGEETGLEALVATLDTAGVPRLLLRRRRGLGAISRTGEASP